jgi:hypothetical protein
MYAPVNTLAGVQPFNDWFVPDTVQRMVLGIVVDAIDPFWGYGRFVYGKAANAISKGNVCMQQVGPPLGTYDKVANAANAGSCVAIAMAPIPANGFGWFLIEGNAVVATNATVAAGAAIGVAAAGVLGTNTAGKQLLGCNVLKSATATQTWANVQEVGNSSVLITPSGYDGAFVGMALSGTGIPGATVVAKLDPDGRSIYMGSAIGVIDKVATAAGLVTLTGTYTGFGLVQVNTAFVQGAIT